MILCVDVQYEDRAAVTACVGFSGWPDALSTCEVVIRSESIPEPYEPGHFYRRELPHLLAVVEPIRRAHAVEAIVIDGHVWLVEGEPGLGAHLHSALRKTSGGEVAIIGVAKTKYAGGVALPVLRGQSGQPLFVTAIGWDAAGAAEVVRGMHGPHRVPTLLKRADQLARGHASPDPAKMLTLAGVPGE
jgi:deoxyribonuclease V